MQSERFPLCIGLHHQAFLLPFPFLPPSLLLSELTQILTCMHDVTQREQGRRSTQRMLLAAAIGAAAVAVLLMVADGLCEKERERGRKESEPYFLRTRK